MYNVAIIGAGPAGIFAALEIMNLKPDWKVVLIDKGSKIEKRKCPIREGSPKCVNCKRCGLLCGWGGAGAFSDGKLTLTPDVGGHLVDYMSRKLSPNTALKLRHKTTRCRQIILDNKKQDSFKRKTFLSSLDALIDTSLLTFHFLPLLSNTW